MIRSGSSRFGTIRNSSSILDPKAYYLVLFDFVDLSRPDTIRASIWQVDPHVPGFALCMVDYYLNIRSNSKSKAPFNFWPYSLKFDIMRPELIYQSLITTKGVNTLRFPGEDPAELVTLKSLDTYSSARNLSIRKILEFARRCGYEPGQADSAKKAALLRNIDQAVRSKVSPAELADNLAWALYHEHIERHLGGLPQKLKDVFQTIKREIP